MKDIYKEENLYPIVKILEDQLEELENWSVYNGDKHSFKIFTIKQLLSEIKLSI